MQPLTVQGVVTDQGTLRIETPVDLPPGPVEVEVTIRPAKPLAESPAYDWTQLYGLGAETDNLPGFLSILATFHSGNALLFHYARFAFAQPGETRLSVLRARAPLCAGAVPGPALCNFAHWPCKLMGFTRQTKRAHSLHCV